MKLQNVLWVAILLIIPGTVWAYSDGGVMPAVSCMAKFSKFTPANNTEVAAKSAFSFFASASTSPNSIKVAIKGQSIPVTVTPKNEGFQVSGKLPDTIKGTYAKIAIIAKGPNQCEASGGWLVKVTQ